MNSLAIDEILRAVDQRPTPAAYRGAARQLSAVRDALQSVRIGLLSSFTIETIVPQIQVEAARAGFAADIFVGPYGTSRQELLDPASGCMAHRPEIVIVAELLEDICPQLIHDFLTLTTIQVEESIAKVVAELIGAVRAFREHSSASVVLHNFARPSTPLLGIHEASAPNSQSAAIDRLNAQLAASAREIAGVYVLDFDRIQAEVGYRNWRDDKMWYLGRAPLSAELMPVLAGTYASFCTAILASPRKCLVVDLDNTLWGGVIGEDGMAGIKLGSTYPGSVYVDLQRAIRALQQRGVLLAINSKNNAADVEEVFDSHPEMLLARSDFASVRINWNAKSDNMIEIADELNVGVDSLVFLDDNPAECDLMRRTLPQVLTIEAFGADGKPDPLGALRRLQQCGAFDRLLYSEEDQRRTALYQDQAQRQQSRNAAASLDDFLRDLDMKVTVAPVNPFTFPRVLDLIHKTNQFNLTTRRHDAATLTAMTDDPDCGVLSLRVADRFGDNGLVGVAIVRVDGATAEVDTFLLSCRVIGRQLETALMAQVVDWAAAQGALRVEGMFIPTAKNKPAADFFANHGFRELAADAHGATRWELTLDQASIAWPSFMKKVEANVEKEVV